MGLFDMFKKKEEPKAAPAPVPVPVPQAPQRQLWIDIDEEKLMEGFPRDISPKELRVMDYQYYKLLDELEKGSDAYFVELNRYAKRGCPSAMNDLAFAYHYGEGVEKDEREYYRWLFRAYYAGEDSAAYFIARDFYDGSIYIDGLGVHQNYEEACNYWMEYVKRGKATLLSETEYESFYQAVECKWFNGTEEEAQAFLKRIEEIKALQAEHQNDREPVYLDEEIEMDEIPVDLPDNLRRELDEQCQALLAMKEEDPEEAYDKLLDLAYEGCIDAMLDVANMCQNGIGTEEDPESALRWKFTAACAGDVDSMYEIGCEYSIHSDLLEKDRVEGFRWYQRAAAAGHAAAEQEIKDIVASIRDGRYFGKEKEAALIMELYQ